MPFARRPALVLLALFSLDIVGGVVPAQEERTIQDRAVITLEVPARPFYVGEAIDLSLYVGLEHRLAREQLIQLFRQKLDVAVRIDTPWSELPEGLEARGSTPGFEGDARAVVDGELRGLRLVPSDILDLQQRYTVWELQDRVVATRPGRFEIPSPALHFAWASAFDEDFFGDPVPRDRNDARIEAGGALPIEVLPLPDEGRPADFAGLIGAFEWTAQVVGDSAGLRVGDVVTLDLTLTGDGDLSVFDPPDWRAGRSFHGRGLRELEAEPTARTFRYELVALRAGDRAIPAVEVAVFQPGDDPGYRRLATEPIPLRIAPRADGAEAIDATGQRVEPDPVEPTPEEGDQRDETPLETGPIPGVDVLFGLREVEPSPGPRAAFAPPPRLPGLALTVGLLLPWLVAGLLWLLRRRAATREVRRLDGRRRRALRRFRKALRDPRSDRRHALADYLAAWLDCAPAAIVDPSLAHRLRVAGVASPTAEALDTWLDALARARFGNVGGAPSDAELLADVTRAEAEFRRDLPRRNRVLPLLLQAAVLLVLGALLVHWLDDPGVRGDRPEAAASTTASATDASPDSADPAHAADLFAAGDPAAAYTVFLACLDAGLGDPADLAFDLGNCAHALGRPAESILWYRRALRLAPRHFEARANLALVESQLGLRDGPAPTLGRTWLDGQLARLAAIRPGRLLLLAVLLQCVGWWRLLLRSRRRLLAVLLLAVGLALAVLVTVQSLRPARDEAVVLRADVRMLAEPHARASARGSMEAGQTVLWLGGSPRWVHARNGESLGWVEKPALETLRRLPLR